jgi:hypothetical protein
MEQLWKASHNCSITPQAPVLKKMPKTCLLKQNVLKYRMFILSELVNVQNCAQYPD